MTGTGQARPPGGTPDPVGLAVARETLDRLKPALVILQGSRAAGDNRPDSDVDLMAVCPDYAILLKVEATLRQLLEGVKGGGKVGHWGGGMVGHRDGGSWLRRERWGPGLVLTVPYASPCSSGAWGAAFSRLRLSR